MLKLLMVHQASGLPKASLPKQLVARMIAVLKKTGISD